MPSNTQSKALVGYVKLDFPVYCMAALPNDASEKNAPRKSNSSENLRDKKTTVETDAAALRRRNVPKKNNKNVTSDDSADTAGSNEDRDYDKTDGIASFLPLSSSTCTISESQNSEHNSTLIKTLSQNTLNKKPADKLDSRSKTKKLRQVQAQSKNEKQCNEQPQIINEVDLDANKKNAVDKNSFDLNNSCESKLKLNSEVNYKPYTVLCGGGGGASRTGVANKIVVLKNNFSFKEKPEPLVTYDFDPLDEAPWCVATCPDGLLTIVGIGHDVKKNKEKNSDSNKEPVRDMSCVLLSRESSSSRVFEKLCSLDTLLKIPGDYLCACAVSDDRNFVATGSEQGVLSVAAVDLKLKQASILSWAPTKIESRIYSIIFERNAKKIYVVTASSILKYSLAEGKLVRAHLAPKGFSFRAGQRDGAALRCIANFGRASSELCVYDENIESPPLRGTIAKKPAVSMAACDGVTAIGLADSTIVIMYGLVVTQILEAAHEGPVSSLVVTRNYVFSGGIDRTVRKWELTGLEWRGRSSKKSKFSCLLIFVLVIAVFLSLGWLAMTLVISAKTPKTGVVKLG